MFSTVYQNGEYGIEIFAPSGNEPFKMCKLSNENNIKKVYDRSIKGYMAALEKESSSTFLQIPRSSKSSLGITQPLLIFQIQLHPEKSFALELILLDSDRQKRRFHLSTNFKEIDANNLHVSIPWTQPDREQWTNVAINLVDLIASYSPAGSNLSYFGLESFSIQPVCRLRKIFTLPLKYLGDEDTGLLIPPKYDFTTGVAAGSWVFHYELPAAPVKTIANKDHESTQKNSKLPSKAAGEAKGSDLMGIVGKKVPRQEPTTSKAISVSKIDAGSGDESALKRQKALPAAPSTLVQTPAPVPLNNPWGSSASTAPTPLKKNDKRDVDVHMVVTVEEPMEVEVNVVEPIAEPSAATAPAPAPAPVPVLPPGGIKLSSKLKQKLSSTVTPSAPVVDSPIDSVRDEVSVEVEHVRAQSPPTAPPKEEVAQFVQDLNHDEKEEDALSVLPTPSLLTRHQQHPTRSSVDEDNLPLASQDFSAIDDFVKNYEAQQGTLQGYASFTRVEAEVAQLSNKLSSATTRPETNETDVAESGGIASSGLQDFMQQVKRHERTPSRPKKFADVALSPMPTMPSFEVARTVISNIPTMQTLEEENTSHARDDSSVHCPAGCNDDDEEEPRQRPQLESDQQSRPPTAPAQSRPPTADHSHKMAPSRPSTAVSHTQEEIVAMHLRLPTPPPTPQTASRPPTALTAESAHIVEHEHVSPRRPTARASASRPSTARLSATQLEAALMSPYSEAMAYFEQSKKSQNFSSHAANADITAEPISTSTDFSTRPSTASHQKDGNENVPPNAAGSFFEVYQERSAAICQRWTEDIESLLEKLSKPLKTSSVDAAAATTKPAPTTESSVSRTSIRSPSALATPLPERKKRAIRARVASLLQQVEQAEMEYIAEFGFEAFQEDVGFFEEKPRIRRQ